MSNDNNDDGTPKDTTLPAVIDSQPGMPTRTPATSWEDVVETFLNTRDSASTRRMYGLRLRRAFAVLGVATVAELNGAMLAAYRRHVVDAMGPTIQSQALATLRSFLAWAEVIGAHHLSWNVVRLALRTPRSVVKKPRNILDERQTGALLAAASAARDHAMLATFLGAGLRISEIAALDCRDLRTSGNGWLLHVRQGKGRKDRLVPIHDEISNVVVAYLATTGREMGSEGPLYRCYDGRRRDGMVYTSAPRRRMSRQAVFRLVKRLLADAGINARAFSPHSLRHTYAMRAFRADASPVHVQKLLGHSSIATTQVYLDHLELPELLAHVPPLPWGEARPGVTRDLQRKDRGESPEPVSADRVSDTVGASPQHAAPGRKLTLHTRTR